MLIDVADRLLIVTASDVLATCSYAEQMVPLLSQASGLKPRGVWLSENPYLVSSSATEVCAKQMGSPL
jgi:hypothetical protein